MPEAAVACLQVFLLQFLNRDGGELLAEGFGIEPCGPENHPEEGWAAKGVQQDGLTQFVDALEVIGPGGIGQILSLRVHRQTGSEVGNQRVQGAATLPARGGIHPVCLAVQNVFDNDMVEQSGGRQEVLQGLPEPGVHQNRTGDDPEAPKDVDQQEGDIFAIAIAAPCHSARRGWDMPAEFKIDAEIAVFILNEPDGRACA